ncbi:MAG TPA: hypothetical protein VER83_09760, partial [Candidatus Nanopelagicales bacterium]|nr:hypothetical protein [Candidatus Nanopelagicales bacterium]
ATWLGVTCWFATSYTNAAIDRYYLGPALIVIAWLGVASGILVEILAPRAADDADPGAAEDPGADGAPWRPARGARLATNAVALVLAASMVLPAALAAPVTASVIDMSADTRAADWSRWALQTMGAGAVVVSWWSFSTPLWYRTILLGERSDLRIVDDRDRLDEGLGSVDDVIRANLEARPVYLVRMPDEIDTLGATWALETIPDPTGIQPLYRVAGPWPAAGRAAPPATPGAPPATMQP